MHQSENNTVKTLKQKIYRECGIPPECQKLFFGNKLLNNSEPIYTLPADCNIFLSMATLGGGGECDICCSSGEFTCSECNNQVTCCHRMHQHPHRANHQPKQIIAKPLHDSSLIATSSDTSGQHVHLEYH